MFGFSTGSSEALSVPAIWLYCHGSSISTTVPRPGSLSILTLPPWSSVKLFTIERPSPVPAIWRESVESICTKGSNARMRCSFDMPMPESSIETRTLLLLISAVTRNLIFPSFGVNLMELLNTFRIICFSRLGSASIVRSGGIIEKLIVIFLFRASGVIIPSAELHTFIRSITSLLISICPAAAFDTSRISFISERRCSPLCVTSFNASFCFSRISPYTPCCSASVMPRILVRGVRSSWLMPARKSSFILEASSRILFAYSSSSRLF